MLYLEDYVELIEHLPVDLRDRFTDMREMDLQVQNTVDDLNGQVKTLFRECLAKKGKVEGADERFENIRGTYKKALDDADEKVQLAGQIYDLVDRHLRKLDQELAKFKMELEADNAGITEILEQRSLDLDNPSGHSSHTHSRRHAAHSSMVTSQSAANLVAAAIQNGPVEKRMKLDPVAEWNHADSAPPSVMSTDLLSSVSGFDSDRSNSRPPSRGSVTGSRHSNGSVGDISLPTFHLGAEPPLARRNSSFKLNQDSLKSQEVVPRTEGHYQDPSAGPSSQKSIVHEDLLDDDSMHSTQEMSISSPSFTRPSRTKKQTSKAAAWNQERMQAEARRGQAREREHSTSYAAGSTVEIADGAQTTADWTPDPHEPRYCLCNQVSFGEMVGCDNSKCAIEWFHYGCVGLVEAPKGKWFCPQCLQSMKRRNKNR